MTTGLPPTGRDPKAGPAHAPEVSVVVVAYRSAACIGNCLASVEPLVREGLAEAIVVDNASPDESGAVVARDFGWARLVTSRRNLGFAGGVNLGLREAAGAAVLLLNPDAVLEPGAVRSMLEHLRAHPRVGAIGPRVVRSDGATEISAGFRPTFRDQVIVTFGLFLLRRWVPSLRGPMLLDIPGTTTEVDVLSGCCILIRRSALDRVGPFDEQFFMYVEDVDWCVRARDAGYEIHYMPQVRVRHDRGHGGSNESLTPMDGGGNVERLFEKHGIPHSKFALRWLRRIHDLSRMAWMAARGLGGRPGAFHEARRFWLTFAGSFGRRTAA